MTKARELRLCIAALAVAACTTSTMTSVRAVAQPFPAPAADPFYAAPAKLTEMKNGAIIKFREIALLGTNLPTHTWQVQYKSTAGDGEPTTGVTTIMVPTTPWTGPGARPLLSYHVAEDSLGTRCAPSYAMRAGLDIGLNSNNLEFPIVALGLLRNWAVAFPDYQGPHERFLDGMQAAHSVLDGIRAARAFRPAGLAHSPVGSYGYSGGAIATLWSAQQQPHYAPDIHFAGIAAGGIPVDLVGAFSTINGTYASGLGVLALAALSRIAPEAKIPALLSNRGRQMLVETADYCDLDFETKFAFTDLRQYLVRPDAIDDSRFRAAAAKARVDSAVPAAPTYIWHSTGDDVLPIAQTDRLVDRWRARGVHVTYARINVPTHAGSGIPGAPAAMDYLAQHFAPTAPRVSHPTGSPGH